VSNKRTGGRSDNNSPAKFEWLHFAFGLLDILPGGFVSIATVNHGQFCCTSHKIPPDIARFVRVLAVSGTSRLHT